MREVDETAHSMLVRGSSVLIIVGTGIALAQTSDFRSIRATPRITRVVDETALIARPGNVHPMARAEFDNGPIPGWTG